VLIAARLVHAGVASRAGTHPDFSNISVTRCRNRTYFLQKFAKRRGYARVFHKEPANAPLPFRTQFCLRQFVTIGSGSKQVLPSGFEFGSHGVGSLRMNVTPQRNHPVPRPVPGVRCHGTNDRCSSRTRQFDSRLRIHYAPSHRNPATVTLMMPLTRDGKA
jgi:hypothetical protein